MLEYLAAEILELAGNPACDNKKHHIVPRHPGMPKPYRWFDFVGVLWGVGFFVEAEGFLGLPLLALGAMLQVDRKLLASDNIDFYSYVVCLVIVCFTL